MTIDFPLAFSALTNGKLPFMWQQRLFADFARGEIPDACDLPTGLGKTSVMAIWLAALDLGNRDIRLPRRLIYVVDRRAVVDQATEEAEQLAKALGDGKTKGIDPVHGEFVNYLLSASGTDRGNGAAKCSGQGRHGRAAVGQIVLPECGR